MISIDKFDPHHLTTTHRGFDGVQEILTTTFNNQQEKYIIGGDVRHDHLFFFSRPSSSVLLSPEPFGCIRACFHWTFWLPQNLQVSLGLDHRGETGKWKEMQSLSHT